MQDHHDLATHFDWPESPPLSSSTTDSCYMDVLSPLSLGDISQASAIFTPATLLHSSTKSAIPCPQYGQPDYITTAAATQIYYTNIPTTTRTTSTTSIEWEFIGDAQAEAAAATVTAVSAATTPTRGTTPLMDLPATPHPSKSSEDSRMKDPKNDGDNNEESNSVGKEFSFIAVKSSEFQQAGSSVSSCQSEVPNTIIALKRGRGRPCRSSPNRTDHYMVIDLGSTTNALTTMPIPVYSPGESSRVVGTNTRKNTPSPSYILSAATYFHLRPSSTSETPRSLPSPPKYLFAEPYQYSDVKVDRRSCNSRKELKIAQARADHGMQ
ncbi:hypothetical protein BC939DRAFT_181392 [Gamsiella multidivaricata]|uniref:uncharacterized protein n=1 Tax=Gamsiella multidivaricata TaxID=101098 RepID=UPI00221F7395|nr:uncharacterized protein BC939DRAFT_181392 [Gamsiella multidivaricata]KAI7822614.1 hypothetical protein BC939DRAFT_181392 [Gamsiella multidivaricata]